jgi:hypothetical protein
LVAGERSKTNANQIEASHVPQCDRSSRVPPQTDRYSRSFVDVAADYNERSPRPAGPIERAHIRERSPEPSRSELLMLRRIGLLLLAAGLLASVAHAEESKVAVQLSGIGALTCAHWRSTAATRAEGVIWIFGFWSGLNYVAAASEQRQPKSSEIQVIAEVARICATDPSQFLASVAWAVYVDFSGK